MKRPALLTQVLTVNALLITATVFAASVAASLHSEPVIEGKRFLVLVAALVAMVLLNGWLLRRRFAPLEELIGAMERLDFGGRDTRARIPTANVEEVARLHQAFDTMLARLEAERARTATAVLQAQEAERARLARDLHDEANQALTGVLLRLEATAQDAPPELRDELLETKRVATQAMGELVRLARELRPVALDDLSMHDDERYLFEALKAGASGYVLKHEADHDLVAAVRAVARGESFLTSAAQRALVRTWMEDENAGPREPLSPREQEVLKLIAEAHTNREISEILQLAEKTVESHRANILRKLGMRDRVELVRYAIRRGLVEP